jgi:hypothetical protein
MPGTGREAESTEDQLTKLSKGPKKKESRSDRAARKSEAPTGGGGMSQRAPVSVPAVAAPLPQAPMAAASVMSQRPAATISVQRPGSKEITRVQLVRAPEQIMAQHPAPSASAIDPIENDPTLQDILDNSQLLSKHIGVEADIRRWRGTERDESRKGAAPEGAEQFGPHKLDRTVTQYKPGDRGGFIPIRDINPIINRPDGKKTSRVIDSGKLELQIEFPGGIFKGREATSDAPEPRDIDVNKFTFVFDPALAVGGAKPRIGRLEKFFIS